MQKAYAFVAQTMIDNPLAGNMIGHNTLARNNQNSETVTCIRLIIAHNLMGTIIGRQGSQIKHIQDVSRARIVASKDMLPNSTERLLEVQGDPEAIYLAIKEIGKCIAEDIDKSVGTILYDPTLRLHPTYADGAAVLNMHSPRSMAPRPEYYHRSPRAADYGRSSLGIPGMMYHSPHQQPVNPRLHHPHHPGMPSMGGRGISRVDHIPTPTPAGQYYNSASRRLAL